VGGTSDEVPLLQAPPVPKTPTDWSRDGRFVLFQAGVGQTDVWALPVASKAGVALLTTQFSEGGARFSPDGRWIAYTSDESGQAEVYIRPFLVGSDGTPSVGGRWQVSNAGGGQPRWRQDGRELFYRSPTGAIMAADVTVDASAIRTGLARQLFELGSAVVSWDVMPDGQRFLIALPMSPQTPEPITVVLNWQTGR
jgi:dipeptidyl aminopeptidase/acylaminoacyl peptidase